MSVLTRDDWHLLTRGQHYVTLAAMVMDFEHTRQHEVAGWGGGTLENRAGERGWFQTTAKGYGWSVKLRSHSSKPEQFDHFVTWAKVKAWVDSLTVEQRSEIEALLIEARTIQREYPNPYPGIGRTYAWDRKPRGTDEEVAADHAALEEAHRKRDIEVEAWKMRRDAHQTKMLAYWASLAPTLLDDMVLAQR